MTSGTEKKKKYPFTAKCSNRDESVNVKLDTNNPDGETCTVCKGTPDGSTGIVCNPTLTPMF